MTYPFFDIKKNHAIVAWFGRGLPMSLEIKTPIVYIVEKFFTTNIDSKFEKYSENYVNGKV